MVVCTQPRRIGFACKWIDNASQIDGIKPRDACRRYQTGTTTVAWLNRQKPAQAEERLWQLMTENIQSVYNLVERVSELEPDLRMVRIGSDVLPVYTEKTWSYFWKRPDVRDYCERELIKAGELARARDVRLSMHPGPYCVLASDKPEIIQRSIEEFEYHVDLARWMGYGRDFQDFKINVHISGRQGPAGIKCVLGRLTPEARNCITIENDEMSWGIDASLELRKHCALVLDLHHHFIRTGEYIQPTDHRLEGIIDSWRGVRPVIHYSVSREDYLVGHCDQTLPDHVKLLESGHKKSKLRAHSDFYWNEAVNRWALGFSDRFDIMCESKAKNLASFPLYEYRQKSMANDK